MLFVLYPLLQSSDAYGGLRQRRKPALNASSPKSGNPPKRLARLCALSKAHDQ
ncbi:MAG: hypothetical protein V7K89_14335 [Nostoc sp.]|uniref:hypothetical protein n=1 Tax=Nostoc sp. TaxID=1180 RepID=UPI002FF81C5C